jgi:nucleotide-binding universal stress UspA family protein
MKFKKILVPVDGSEHSTHALRYALGLSQSQGAQVVLLHSYGSIPMLIGGEAREELTRDLREESEKLFAPFAATLREAGLEPVLVIREGRPENVIVEEARKGGYDLIVMGSRGLSDMAGVFLGSVAHRVLAAAHCPVLVTR